MNNFIFMFLSLTIDKGNSYLTIGCVHEYYVRWNIKITYENISIFMLLSVVLLSFSLILGELTAEVPSCYKVWGTSTLLFITWWLDIVTLYSDLQVDRSWDNPTPLDIVTPVLDPQQCQTYCKVKIRCRIPCQNRKSSRKMPDVRVGPGHLRIILNFPTTVLCSQHWTNPLISKTASGTEINIHLEQSVYLLLFCH